jgi:large subunit ribosomal protein L15
MQIDDLSPAEGSRRGRKRVGRGHGSGFGGRSGRGDKGQNSRSGGGKGPYFEGGQNPVYRRLPKLPGFRNPFRVEYLPVNLSRLEDEYDAGDVVDIDSLHEHGIIKSKNVPVKVLGGGELTKSLTVKVDAVSGSAREKIETAGGTVEAQ